MTGMTLSRMDSARGCSFIFSSSLVKQLWPTLIRDYMNTFIDMSDMSAAIVRKVCSAGLADRFVFGNDMPQYLGYGGVRRPDPHSARTSPDRRKQAQDPVWQWVTVGSVM